MGRENGGIHTEFSGTGFGRIGRRGLEDSSKRNKIGVRRGKQKRYRGNKTFSLRFRCRIVQIDILRIIQTREHVA